MVITCCKTNGNYMFNRQLTASGEIKSPLMESSCFAPHIPSFGGAWGGLLLLLLYSPIHCSYSISGFAQVSKQSFFASQIDSIQCDKCSSIV